IGTTRETRIAGGVAALAHLAQNLVERFGIVGKPILRMLGFAQSPQDCFPLLRRTRREIRASVTRHQPSYPGTDTTGSPHRPEHERTVWPTCLAPLQIVARGHIQIGRPLDLLAQTNEDRSGGLSNAIVPVPPSHYISEGAETIVAVGQTSRDHARTRQRVEDAQQAGFGIRRCDVEVLQRRNLLRLQDLEDLDPTLQSLDRLDPWHRRSSSWRIV